MPTSSPDSRSRFEKLFQYNEWATNRIVDTMKGATRVPDRAVELLSHLVRTQDVWYGRARQTDHADLDFWTTDPLPPCEDRFKESTRRWITLLDEHPDDHLQQTISYTNSNGSAFESPLREILTHVVNHGTHHRAQIARVLREAEIAPPPTDFIFYVREE